MNITLICPYCRVPLTLVQISYNCPNCGRHFPIKDGIISFLKAEDDFYEGAYENQVQFTPQSEEILYAWPLWLINSGYPWMVRKYVPAGSTVMEFGCAGGVKYFGKRYKMIGCDLSALSLKKLDGIYDYCLQADATQTLPLLNDSLDAIVSSYFWEHIPPDIKPVMLTEFFRILRPGGKIIFLYDVETDNPLIRQLKKKDMNLYKKLFIEGDGHLEYETIEKNLFLYENAGYTIKKVHPANEYLSKFSV